MTFQSRCPHEGPAFQTPPSQCEDSSFLVEEETCMENCALALKTAQSINTHWPEAVTLLFLKDTGKCSLLCVQEEGEDLEKWIKISKVCNNPGWPVRE